MNDTKRGFLASSLTPAFVLLAIALGAGVWFEKARQHSEEVFELRIASAENEAQFERLLESEFEILFAQLSTLREDLEDATARAAEAGLDTNTRLGQVGQAIEAQAMRLSAIDEQRIALDLKQTDQSKTIQASVDEQWQELTQALADTREAVRSEHQARLTELARLDARVPDRDVQRMWNELMGPVVMLSGESSVGSGVLIDPPLEANEHGYGTYLLTAWHVVRDIETTDQGPTIPVRIYSQDGSTRDEFASLLAKDATLDAALLELRTPEPLPYKAPLASRLRLADRQIFDRIYAVGCPLGNDPIPTFGEIATRTHEVEGEIYWMINAPTYIGNSGGGIFDADSSELLGIFSKIYTHGSLRPTIVPHMGLATPLNVVYDWLESEGFDFLGEGTVSPTLAVASGD